MTPDQIPALRLTRRLIDYGRAVEASRPYFAHPAAAAVDHLYLDLSRWVGADGCHALFLTALEQARAEHPLLETIELRPRSTPYLEGVEEAVERHGAEKIDEALEAMLAISIGVLARLVGSETAANLIERSLPESR